MMSWKIIAGRTNWTKLSKSNTSKEEVMVKKKAKAKKKVSALDKIKKELAKLEALHEKENAIVENINDIIEDEEDDDSGWL